MKRLNNNNLDVYLFLDEFIIENGYAPSYREIIKGTNYKSPATIKEVIEKLSELKFISVKRDEKGNIISKSIKVLHNEDTKQQIKELRSEK